MICPTVDERPTDPQWNARGGNMAPDSNFKDQDPKKQYNRPENPKDRSGSYDSGQDFDPTEGFDNHPDDQYTSDMVKEEDEFFYREGQPEGSGEDETTEKSEDEATRKKNKKGD